MFLDFPLGEDDSLFDGSSSTDRIIANGREAKRIMTETHYETKERDLEPVLMAGIRMKGKYQDCGKGFRQIEKKLGRFIGGKAFCLHFDNEYKENDADFEACMPLHSKGMEVEGISIRELPGGRAVCLIHKGGYDQIGRSYAKVGEYVEEKGYPILIPIREVYLKGPGMFFKGNPKNYLTEIQMLIES
ncbi:MAG: GyrI-like domain-containing protein [Candidatus Hydrogenedentes bacterium]|jgi:effector-binding domain-containing protein|nr:GyrI-like domain-containing protein [Candidatus Hydrogenedentota bacterium]